MEKTPRELFVEKPFEASAYENTALPIACGQTISQPFVVASITEALDVTAKHRVLEIGTGSGYQAAVLARLAGWVYTVERHRPLLDERQGALRQTEATQCGGPSWRRTQGLAGTGAVRPHRAQRGCGSGATNPHRSAQTGRHSYRSGRAGKVFSTFGEDYPNGERDENRTADVGGLRAYGRRPATRE